MNNHIFTIKTLFKDRKGIQYFVKHEEQFPDFPGKETHIDYFQYYFDFKKEEYKSYVDCLTDVEHRHDYSGGVNTDYGDYYGINNKYNFIEKCLISGHMCNEYTFVKNEQDYFPTNKFEVKEGVKIQGSDKNYFVMFQNILANLGLDYKKGGDWNQGSILENTKFIWETPRDEYFGLRKCDFCKKPSIISYGGKCQKGHTGFSTCDECKNKVKSSKKCRQCIGTLRFLTKTWPHRVWKVKNYFEELGRKYNFLNRTDKLYNLADEEFKFKPMTLDSIHYKNGNLEFKTPYTFYLQEGEDGNDGLIEISDNLFFVYAKTRDELYRELEEQIQMMWMEYVEKDPTNFTTYSLKLRDDLQNLIEYKKY